MYSQPIYDPYVLSSVCPYSCAIVSFALQVGGTIDPEFLMQCQIADPKFEKAVNALKPVPLKFEAPLEHFNYQEDIFLDMGAPNQQQFYDAWAFKQYNTWVGSQDQWNSTYDIGSDIIIDLI
ncbi:unnamed protein product [Adineta steineri]|uniref:Uncharacterized protein n=1 Tax=Adineta steineri TaxID=433720 RepID=A0A819PMX8_9BILA|nr:unnamed protein product [Adineta steineri]CAF1131550.1 unnamed protein product [Adineta steineri]CAF3699540.1 unnamed protein product [Adineta steineri]CAF4017021.1 unnamed protein product [Adineta steineri]